jgi:hypothetical protein
MEHARLLGNHWKTKPTNNVYRKWEEMQVKGIGNTFYKITAENFPNHEKEMTIHTQEAFMTPNS